MTTLRIAIIALPFVAFGLWISFMVVPVVVATVVPEVVDAMVPVVVDSVLKML